MKISRRGFVRTLAGGSLVVGFNAATRRWVAAAEAGRRVPFERVPALDGTLLLDEGSRRAYAQDYGQIVHEEPLAVLRPGSAEDIVRMVGFARRFGLRVAARGQGHQPFGQAQVEGGVVIDMRPLQRVHSMSDDGIDVDAGADWRAVVQAALGRGSTLPVLTAYLGLTVGGTVAIGGVGTATCRHGAQVDHVRALQVVTGEGQLLACSEERRRDLFEAALAGQGQCGIVTRATLGLVPAARMVREYALPYADLETLLQDETLLAEDGRFDGVVGLVAPTAGRWTFSLVANRQFSPPDAPDDAALKAGLRYLAGAERVRDVAYPQYAAGIPTVELGPAHPDLGLLVRASAAEPFLASMLPRLTPGDLGAASGLRLFCWKSSVFTRPLFRLPGEGTVVYVAALRTPTTDPAVVARMLAGNRTLFERNRELGGTLYPFSAVRLSDLEWQQHYGPAWSALARAKRRYDPDRLFASGPDVFRGSDAP